MSAVTLRGVAPEDFDAWCALWRAYLAFYDTELPQAQYDTAFARLLSDDPASFRGLLAMRGDRPVGLVHYVFHPHMWRAEGVCYLQDLYAAPDVRGQGVGRALIEGVYRAADAEGVPSVYWLTQEFNYAGRMLYDRVGVKTPFIRYNRPA